MTAATESSNQAMIAELKRRGLWTLTVTIARAYFTTPGRVIGSRRIKRDVEARQGLWAAIYDMGTYKLIDIGLMFNRDHTTVLYGIRKHKRRIGLVAA